MYMFAGQLSDRPGEPRKMEPEASAKRVPLRRLHTGGSSGLGDSGVGVGTASLWLDQTLKTCFRRTAGENP